MLQVAPIIKREFGSLFGKLAYVFAGDYAVKLFERAGEIGCGVVTDHIADDRNVGFALVHQLSCVVHSLDDEKFGKYRLCLFFEDTQEVIGVEPQVMRHVFSVHIAVRNVSFNVVKRFVDVVIDIVWVGGILAAINDGESRKDVGDIRISNDIHAGAVFLG